MDANVSAQTLHLVVDSDPALHSLTEQLRQSGLSVSSIPAATGVAGLESVLDRDLAGQVFSSISLYSHASQGQLSLGADRIDASTLRRYRSVFEALGRHLEPGGDLLLYGCDLAAGSTGRDFIQQLSDLTGADVAASTNMTGHAGDWNLEYRVGTVATPQRDVLTGLAWDGNLSTTITTPIRVPLHWLHEDGDADHPRKLGLYVTLANGSQPQILEFDTGGSGLYATYAPGDASPWWGPSWSGTGASFTQSYDSGLTYSGDGVRTPVSLFSDAVSTEPLLTFNDVVVGQAQRITRTTDSGVRSLWPLPSADAEPPVNGAFFGDFGMALRPGQTGIDSLAAQLSYGKGVRAGFRVHASSENPWVQFGLKRSDLRQGEGTMLELNKGQGRSATGVPFYKFIVVKGSLAVDLPRSASSKRQTFDHRTGFVLDTGASTTIHSGGSLAFPSRLTEDRRGERVADGARVTVRADHARRADHRDQQQILHFTAGDTIDQNLVTVQTTGRYYLNTGILPFLSQDVIYDLQGGRLRLQPRQKS